MTETQCDRSATHIPVLLACLERVRGPILEFGTGWYSTPLIHAFSVRGRLAVSVESNRRWHRRMLDLVNHRNRVGQRHQLVHVTDYGEVDLSARRWGVVFVDHAPWGRRCVELERLAKCRVDVVVLHDSQYMPKYDQLLSGWKHRFDDGSAPTTSVVSNSHSLEWLHNSTARLAGV